ncbi:beta-glucoside-specific PTS transporter subunit IIABC [Niallia taxi]|uniref:beta-glucoside-specific PTS transporter subunit IIABC n=1 Tax=Niallia taxi TaxID=2499688 RepID=UPI002E1A9308|nr:beta-glucoside-specific PTS transporter subunit IIABC [Niallia taxi]MED4041313.1 beta-glucoside-specific PTS transporter subunit IIABC [Niallia taxi]
MDFQKLAQEILENIGGQKNISNVTHCATRLRFNLHDSTKVNNSVLKNTKGILGVVNNSGQFQLIIGPEVSKAYEALMHSVNLDSDIIEEPKSKEKTGLITKLLDVIAGVFTPILPAIIGAGLIKSVLAIAVLCGIDTNGQTYYFLNFIGDAPLYFLPVMLAFTAAAKFKCNQFIAVAIAGAMVHPSYTALVTDQFNIHFTSFLGIPVTLATYSSSVIPILLTVWILSYVDRFLEKHLPKMLKFFLKPLLCILLVAPLAFIVLGPIGFVAGTGISTGLNSLNSFAPWLVPTIIGTIFPLMVTTGMHYGLVPFMIQSYATIGYETIAGPGNLASNTAQGAAALCVAIKTKNKNLKQVAFSSGITAVLGITEPALFGVTLKIKRALYAVMIGGGVGGFYSGITGVKGYAFSSPGLLSLPAFIGPNGWTNLIHACISMVIAFLVTFIVLWFWGFEDIPTDQDKNTNEKREEKQSKSPVLNETIKSPINGEIINLKDVNDPTFAQEMLGKGLAIEPREGRVVSPINGVVTVLFPTKHAIGLTSDKGTELLIHIGLDTVNLKGKYFTSYIKEGDRITVGQPLVDFDMEQIKGEGYETVTPIIITNSNQYKVINNLASGLVNEKDNIIDTIFDDEKVS